jgi:hypothetical protein
MPKTDARSAFVVRAQLERRRPLLVRWQSQANAVTKTTSRVAHKSGKLNRLNAACDPPPQQIESELRCEGANARPVAQELALQHLRAGRIGQCEKRGAHGH